MKVCVSDGGGACAWDNLQVNKASEGVFFFRISAAAFSFAIVVHSQDFFSNFRHGGILFLIFSLWHR